MIFVYVSVTGLVLAFWVAGWVAGYVQGRRSRMRAVKAWAPAEASSGVYVEAYATGPAPIVFGTVSDIGPSPGKRETVPWRYVGRSTFTAERTDNMDDFAIDPMAPDSAKLTVIQAAIAFELWQVNRWKPQ